MNKKFLFIGFTILLLIIFLAWLFAESSKPLPGTKMSDLGRDHVPLEEKVEYNSNPPTSGKHNADWIRSGVYETPKEDAYLVHSLEHGYVIMSYNCDVKTQGFLVKNAYAHGLEEEGIGEEASGSGSLPQSFKTDECHTLVDQLISIYEKKGKTRIIVIPRPNLDTRIALTAWTYIDKFNDFDQGRIENFIDAHLNQGPEKTME